MAEIKLRNPPASLRSLGGELFDYVGRLTDKQNFHLSIRDDQ